MEPLKTLFKKKNEIEKKIGYRFNSEKLFSQIFLHKSFYNETPNLNISHNERLEFLGDSVLGLIMADLLFELLPEVDEGVLSYHLSNLVNAKFCLYYIKKLNLQNYLILGKGETKSVNKGRETILSDAFEALIAGIYLDSNLKVVRGFFCKHFKEDVIEYLKSPVQNYKAILQDFSQRRYQVPPIYKVVKENGPAHDKTFLVEVYVNNKLIGKGSGSSKKQAEQMAAKDAVKKIKE